MLSRRELIKLGLYGGGAALLHLSDVGGKLAWALDDATNLPPSPPSKPFQVPLPVPPFYQPVDPSTLPNIPTFNDGFGTTYYKVTMREASVPIFPSGPKTVIWGYNGQYPGPTFGARLDHRIVVRQHNNLPVNTIVHRHGGHNPSDSDGSALFSEQIAPNTYRDFIYPNDDDVGASNWYHDHDIDFTGHNVYMGLAGFYLLDDDVEDAFNLPGAPGDIPPNPGDYPFEMALVFQDRVFDANNQLVYNPFDHDGFLGDTFLVNGAIQPVMKVYNRKYRFHVLNGSNARFYQLVLSNGMPFQVIASEGGFLTKRVDVGNFRLGMGERLEFILDFSTLKPGTPVVLNNIMQQSNGRGPDGVDPRSPTPLMRFDVQALPTGVTDRSSNPVTLRADLPVFDPSKASQTVNLEFNRSNGAWQVNGKFFDPTRIDFRVKLNSTVIFNFKNGGGGWFHPIHLHRNEFFILDRNGKLPGPLEQGLKDIVVLAGGEQARVVTTFSDARVATATRPAAPTTRGLGPYVLHCHNIEHEDMRMMVVFNVDE